MKKTVLILLGIPLLVGCANKTDIPSSIIENKEHKLIFEENFEANDSLEKLSFEGERNSFSIVEDTAIQNNKKMKVLLHSKTETNRGIRAEFKPMVKEELHKEYIYQFNIMIDENYVESKKWQSIFQLHDQPDYEQGETWEAYGKKGHMPPFMILYVNGKLTTHFNSKGSFREASEPVELKKNTWYTICVNVKNETTNKGFIRAFVDEKEYIKTPIYYPTVYNSACNYAKFGIYRDKEIDGANAIYYDNVKIYEVY